MTKKPAHCVLCATRSQSVFCELTEGHLSILDQAKTSNTYQPHQVIFYEGNQPFGLYCLTAGKVKIYKSDAEGHQDIVRLAGPGDILGYRCLLAGEPYTATAETIEPAEVCFVDKATFMQILESHPPTAFRVMNKLARDIRSAEEQVTRVVHRSVRERMAEFLLVLRKKYGEETDEGIRINLSLTRAEWADLVGTTQESIIRLISELRHEGVISATGREIVLHDIPRLIAYANLQD